MTDSPTIRPSAARPRVAVVFGGTSSEHEISCLTAGSVLNAIDRDRYEVVPIGITRSGRWVVVPDEFADRMRVIDGTLPELSEDLLDAIWLRTAGGSDLAITSGAFDISDHQGTDSDANGTLLTADDAPSTGGSALARLGSIDVAFALLHGPFGEDGTIQGMFEMLGIRYVGAGVAASAIGMDKDLMKHELRAAGLAVCPWVTITKHGWDADRAALLLRVEADLRFPVYVKPARGGSSVGITKVDRADDLEQAVLFAQKFDPKLVVEEAVLGAREIEFAVLGGRGAAPRVSLPGEIVMREAGAFYDFDAKYVSDDDAALLVPTEMDDDLRRRAADVAARTFEAMGAEGLARVDLFITADGHVLVNEINTMPGFTHISMFPSLWAASGLDYTTLITDLIDQALERPVGLR